MPVTPQRLRRLFAAAAIVLVLVVAIVFIIRKLRIQEVTKNIPQTKLPANIQQATQGFTYSYSEGGRTLFTIHAANAQLLKEGGRSTLSEVNIVVYGRQSNRFDQIYGKDFEYDPNTGDITAHGEVHIDLQGYVEGPNRPDQAPPAETKNPIHLRTTGLTFNRKTGIARTDQVIDFRLPQASGTAHGATYDSKSGVMTLKSTIHVTTTGAQPATITAAGGEITKDPRQAVLRTVKLVRAQTTAEANTVTLAFRDDNSIDRMLASGNVQLTGSDGASVTAPQGELRFDEKNLLRTGALLGGVTIDRSGPSPLHGTAGRITLAFGGNNQLQKISALDTVHFTQVDRAQTTPQQTEITAAAVDFVLANNRLQHGNTSGAAQITIAQAPKAPAKPSTTMVTAGTFAFAFDAKNHLRSLHGAPDAKIVSTSPGEPPKTSTSQSLDVAFAPTGGISAITQQGAFRYVEADRSATAARARYTTADQLLALSGSPRVTDGALSTSANELRLNRATGDVAAEGDVKSTYTDMKQQPGGAIFAGSDPIHATGATMLFHRATSVVRFSGGARLWQGANIIEAPTIEFDRNRRTLTATGSPSKDVSTVFVQTDKNGRVTPVNVTGSKLTYSDADRHAHLDGKVVLRGADATITADHVDLYLLPRGQQPASGASQIERIVAEGGIQIAEPSRRATGQKLVYTGADGKFVLTGGPPSIFDAEHGSISGDSLTFYSRDDRVVVGSGNSSRTVTQTRVNQ
jgi:lipopolysaccharide export system protein LptA